MRICLDTNAYSAIGKGNAAVSGLVEAADEIILPSPVFGELMYGFLLGNRFSQNEA